ncbi:MAG: RNA 2',3'-cyclic phosphodiesterase [Acidobacteria bacterium]|nr:RNA 2',3'-cyclic phosphodiesterase [Acidobacteriota bacterium]
MRAFLAIEIDDEIKNTVLKLIERASSRSNGISWVKKDQIHLTLFFFEDLKDEDVEKVNSYVEEIAKSTEPFTLEIKGNGFFGRKENPRVFWLGFEGKIGALKEMQAKISTAFKEIGYLEDKNFNPHLTIGRNRSGRSQNGVVSTLLEYRDFSAGSFLVKSITLFKSELQKGGAIHTPLRKFQLGEMK